MAESSNSSNTNAAKNYIDAVMSKNKSLVEKSASLSKRIVSLMNQKAELEALKRVPQEDIEARERIENLRHRLSEARKREAELIKLKKEQHNKIMELKGNIRVFCRVRPLKVGEESVISFQTKIENAGRGVLVTPSSTEYLFDKVFDEGSSQDDIFIEVSDFVQSVLDGSNVCIFAYGQTGSGKTHTMLGKTVPENEKGLIPRSLDKIFQERDAKKAQGWSYKIEVSMIEIYEENVHDLMEAERPIRIVHKLGEGHTKTEVTSIDQVNTLLGDALGRRTVRKTDLNERSSRSHFIFSLFISGATEGKEVQSVLNLIDLSSSQRSCTSSSSSIGVPLNETTSINNSLLFLGNMLRALLRNDNFIPYRDTKITILLKTYLEAKSKEGEGKCDSKVLMFVNVSPEAESAHITKEALKFAQDVA